MPITDRKFKSLTLKNVNRAPLRRGVYALYEKRDLVFLGNAVGKGDTIRSRLKDHLKSADATLRYKREPSMKPRERLKSLLAEYVAAHGHPPAQNAPEKK